MKSENDIKRKFESRRIEPSDHAWEQIAKQLSQKENSRKEQRLKYIAVAAGFISLLTISTWYFYSPLEIPQNQHTYGTTPTLVYEQATPSSEEHTVNLTESPVARLTSIKNQPTEKHDQDTEILKESTYKIKESSKPSIQSTSQMNEAVNQQVALLLAEVSQAEQEGDSVSDEAVDRLLKEAQERIAGQYQPDNPGVLSAVALLEDVENELDQSFRERVFEALKAGLEKAREAIAARQR